MATTTYYAGQNALANYGNTAVFSTDGLYGSSPEPVETLSHEDKMHQMELALIDRETQRIREQREREAVGVMARLFPTIKARNGK